MQKQEQRNSSHNKKSAKQYHLSDNFIEENHAFSKMDDINNHIETNKQNRSQNLVGNLKRLNSDSSQHKLYNQMIPEQIMSNMNPKMHSMYENRQNSDMVSQISYSISEVCCQYNYSAQLKIEKDSSIELLQYFKESPFFNPQVLKLGQLLKIQNKQQLQTKASMINDYFNLNKLNEEATLIEHKPVARQFLSSVHKLPDYSIIYFGIKQAGPNRFNILIRSPSGELIAYYQAILKSKIVTKIIKLILGINKHIISVIINSANDYSFASCMHKLAENEIQFIYYYDDYITQEYMIDNHYINDRFPFNKQNKSFYTFDEDHLVVHSQIFVSQQSYQLGITLIRKAIDYDRQDDQILNTIRGDIPQSCKQFSLDFLAANIYRIYRPKSQKIIEIIQKLFMQQQTGFENKVQKKKKKQFQLENINNVDSHFPERMTYGRHCKRCENLPKKKLKKSQFRCEGCSASLRRDIPLCPGCFSDFHQRIEYFIERINKNGNKIAQNKNKTLNEQISSEEEVNVEDQFAEKDVHIKQQKYIFNKETSVKILKLGAKIDEYKQTMKSLIDQNQLKLSSIILSSNLINSLKKMNQILINNPNLAPGFSSYGQGAIRNQHIFINHPELCTGFYQRVQQSCEKAQKIFDKAKQKNQEGRISQKKNVKQNQKKQQIKKEHIE